MKKRPEDEREKNKKPKYVPPKKPFRAPRGNALPIAAAATLAILSAPTESKSSVIDVRGVPLGKATSAKAAQNRGNDIDINLNQTIAGEYSFEGGRASIEEIPRLDQNIFEGRYRIEFHIEGKRFSIPVRFNGPPANSLGSPISIFFSKTRTAILTYNYLLITQGYQDVLDNPETLRMDGQRLGTNSFWVRLPQELRGGNTISSAAADGPTGEATTIFALGRDALWSFRADVEGGSPVKEGISISGRASLHKYGDYVFLFQPDSQENFVSVYRRDEEGGRNLRIASFHAARSASSAEAPDVSEIPGGLTFSAGNQTAVVMFDEATHSFTVAAAATND